MTQDVDHRNGVWVTPREVFDPIQSEFHLEVDAAASADNALLPEYWTEETDAFKQDWTGRRVWCNPPYGRQIGRWVEQFANAPAQIVVALLPARTDTRWFHQHIYRNPRCETRFLPGRIKFSNSTGPGKFPSMLCIFTP